MDTSPVTTLTSTELARLAGLTYRQVDYWAQSGLLRPCLPSRGSGTSRQFEPSEVHVARVVGRLSSIGVEGTLLRVIARALRNGATSVEYDGWVVGFGPGVTLHTPIHDDDGPAPRTV